MLSLSLFRGYGLFVLVAPTYRKPKKPRPRPLLNCPRIHGDLFKDARTLLASDNPIAAAMTARVEIERLLTTLAMERPDFGPYWIGAKPTAVWLRKRRIIKLRTCEAVLAALDTGNGTAHGEQVSKNDVGKMFNAINSLRGIVHLKGGAA